MRSTPLVLVLSGIVGWTAIFTTLSACEGEGSGLSGAVQPTGPGSTGSGASGSGGSGSGGAATEADCNTYCDAITKHCTDENAMYSSDGSCFDVCKLLPAGSPGDQNENSLACRMYFLGFAEEEPAPNCNFAGPGTEGKCGGSCENFCFLAQKACTGEQAMWPSQDACVQDCQDFDKTKPYQAGATGDNLACRLYQLTQAADNPLQFCNEIGEDSEACVDPIIERDGGMGGMGGLGMGGMGGLGMGGMAGMGGMGMAGMGGMGMAGMGGMGGSGGN